MRIALEMIHCIFTACESVCQNIWVIFKSRMIWRDSLTHLIHSSFRMDFVILISFHPVFTVRHKHTSRKVKSGKAYQGMY